MAKAMKPERRGLGRGLSALMSDVDAAPAPETKSTTPRNDTFIDTHLISPNPDQPRRTFDEAALADLTKSVAEKGILQPLILRRNPRDEKGYEIIAGERRWRAAQRAQIHKVPAVVRVFSDTEVLEIAIIENIQRDDLNAIEEAAGYQQLMERFGRTQEQMAQALGKSRSYIANLLRLLTLPEDVQAYVRDGKLSAGHARALITSDDPSALAAEVLRRGLSVRETEKLVTAPRIKEMAKTPTVSVSDADTKALEKDLSAALGMKVSIDHKDGTEKGVLTVRYSTLEDLDEVCRRLSVTTGAGEI